MKNKALVLTVVFFLILVTVPVISMIRSDQPLSEAERRPLTQWMSISQYKQIHHGADSSDYLSYLETYLLDQFPFRDTFRSINAIGRIRALRQKDYNRFYQLNGHLAKLDPLLHQQVVERALALFNQVSAEIFNGRGQQVFALIPDKNVFLAGPGNYPHYSYERMFDLIASRLSGDIQLLPLLEDLSLEAYYRTDPHWDQTKINLVASRILEALGHDGSGAESYQTSIGLEDYLGTYAGQAGIPVKPDRLSRLTSPTLEALILHDPIISEQTGVYQKDRLEGIDPYDFFMGGAKPLLVLDNPTQDNGLQLVVFRDSFGSSLIPLLSAGYSQVIVIDLRYISMQAVSGLVDLDPGADVLHLYSTSVLNSPGAFMN